jgi:glyoxylase-like metal-dependent hydrolase (beta-lactamase superfamily II)
MFRRPILAASFVALAAVAFFASSTGAQFGLARPIAAGVWFIEGDLKQHGHCNNILLEMKDYLIVVDANFPSGARLAIAEAKKVSSKPIKYVFDTHHHGDHAYGNPVFTKLGATTLAHKGVAEEMKRYEPKRWLDTAKERNDVGELKLPTAEPPKQTFDQSPYVLDDGSRKVEFHFFGWAHTRGDGFVFLPKERIVCTGDAIVNGPYNYVGDGNIGNWPNVIRAVQKLDPARVLPAHGVPGGPEVLSGQLQFFLELRKAVQGKKLEEVVTMKGDQPVAAKVKLPDAVQNWVGDFYPAQVHGAWREATEKKPIGEILGGR